MKINEIIHSKLANIYLGSLSKHLEPARGVIVPCIDDIVHVFILELMEVPDLFPILKQDSLRERFKLAIHKWLNELLGEHTEKELWEFIKYQIRIGKIHAEININLHYVFHGIRIIKREVFSRIETHIETKEQQANCFFVVDELIDIVGALLSDSYFESLVKHETNALSLRINAMTHDVSMECERLRGLLFDWSRSTVKWLYQSTGLHNQQTLPLLRHSDFGLWVIYKSDLIFPQVEQATQLNLYVEQVDKILMGAIALREAGDNKNTFHNAVDDLHDSVSRTAWFISTIIDQTRKLDVGKDSLTKLFNRRYLDTILRRQTEISQKQGFSYAVLLVDIDYFKKINDTHGHDSGDTILKQVSHVLVSTVRTSDFLFRYGGEEFLVVVGNANDSIATRVAEKIRANFEGKNFETATGINLKVTCSIGVALYDGHPDYNQIVTRADEALYKAKQNGRNQVWLAKK